VIRAAVDLIRDIYQRDPPFVRGGSLRPQEVPVFTFHTLEPGSFERRLRFLVDNGYSTPSLADYARAIEGGPSLPAKSVLLTIDDGRATTWTVGAPLLRRYGLRGVAFLVTSAVHDSGAAGPQWDGGMEPGLEREELGDRPFVSWGEVERMSDVIEPESHTHRHALVPTGVRVVARLLESQRRGYAQFDVPFVWYEGAERRGSELPAGHPLPESAPRLSSRRAFRTNESRPETEAERVEAITREFVDARRTLRERVGRDSVAVCYPWHVAAPDVPAIARAAGHRLGFAGKREALSAVDGALRIDRVGEDYVERLPGVRRRPLPAIVVQKLARRFR
jgi:peptidoglycan/xylan/chitin deacetylase (PgdA/CDA1 family)